MSAAAASSASPIPIWILRLGQCTTTPAPSQEPVHRRDDHQHQRRRLHRHELCVDEGLRHHRQGVADVQRARYQLHRHQAPQLIDGGRRRERSDAERIEEIGDEADHQLQRCRHDEPAANQRDGVEDEHSGEADEQDCFSVHG